MGIEKILKDEIEYFVAKHDETSLAEKISQNIPVTYRKDGTPLSFFTDDEWNYSAYRDTRKNQSDASHVVQFKRIKSEKIKNEIKHAFSIIFYEEFSLEGNSMIIRNYASDIFPVVNELYAIGINTFSEINPISIIQYLESIKGKFKVSTVESKLGILNTISKVKQSEFLFTLPIKSNNAEFTNTISSLGIKYGTFSTKEQALYIPDKVHQTLLEKALEQIADADTELIIDGNKTTKLDLLNSVLEQRWSQIQQSYSAIDKGSMSNRHYQATLTKWRNDRFGTLTSQVENAGIDGVIISSKTCKEDVFGYIGRLFAASVIIILSFSAMRYDEFKTLKQKNAFVTKKYHDTTFHYIVAYESKITGGEEVDYISAPITRKAIEIIDKLHQPARNLLPDYKDNPFLMFSHKDRFLPQFGTYTPVRNNLQKFIEYYDIRITVEDIVANKTVNKNRKNLDVGTLWPIKSHQFRRTLVVNFISHKLADIDALKQQVKHMYQYMTSYYGNGADAALVAGLKTDEELMEEIANAVVESNINLFKRFHQTDEQLGGEKGNDIMLQRENMSALTEEEVAAFVEAGLWNVSLSPFGYCTKGNDCSKTNILDPSACSINCETTILTIENAYEWRKLYWKNIKLLNGGLLTKYKGLAQQMELQNRVALKIMKQFNLLANEEHVA